MSNQSYITKPGLDKLAQELKVLKTDKRKAIASRIQEAKELGDLSENAEYAEAKNEQAFIEGRIIEIENLLKNAIIIKAETGSEVVKIGCTVIFDGPHGEKKYTIVGSNEADPSRGLISNESPIGQAFLGSKVGDTVEVKLPKGVVHYSVTSIK
ncbi:MAG: transcription elongation factor GreA [Patescibacteria group bacterium]